MIYDEEVLPEEIKTERNIYGQITVSVLIGIGLGFVWGYMSMAFVTPALQMIYVIGNCIIGFVLSLPYKSFNPKKRLITSIRYMFMRTKLTYHPIEFTPDPIEEE